ncbi:MAG: hypothetical protein N3A59_07105 [Thermodesulfovibrionales bacterium]|nr:hypothetical protein [Thermodesulfovibrionales bacterium]
MSDILKLSLLRDADTLKKESRSESLKVVAKEMETLFAYELIKAMRRSLAENSNTVGLGKDVYMSLFDMEVAKLCSERGFGLKDYILKNFNNRLLIKEK